MTTRRFLFAVAGIGLLSRGLVLAAEPPAQSSGREPPATHEAVEFSTGPAQGGRTRSRLPKPDEKGPKSKVGRAGPENPSRVGPVGFGRGHSSSMGAPQAESNQTAGAAREGSSIISRGSPREQPPGWWAFGRETTTQSPGAVRHRGVTAPVIGGAATAGARNSPAVIDGTATKRKPWLN